MTLVAFCEAAGLFAAPKAPFPVVASRTALINVDMQNCFVEGYPVSAPEGRAVLRKINRLASACRAAGVLVIHTAHVLRVGGSNAGVMREIIPSIRAGLIDRGSHAAALHRDLEVNAQDIVLEKPRFGAFGGTDLDLILRARGIDSVVICGIATNVCCETTAREAAMRDFRLFFLSDATATFDLAGVSREEIQRTVCATLTLFGRVLTMDSLLDEIAAQSIQKGVMS
jgi:ureidoacrylate peracid hydrolase